MKTKTLKFHGNEITFAKIPFINGEEEIWAVPTKFLGQALGYANDGQSFANLVANSWSKKWSDSDYITFTGESLAALKKATSRYDVAFKQSSHVSFLTMSGVIKALMSSNAKMAREFRDFFAKNGGELLAGHTLKPLRSAKKDAQLKLPLGGEELSAPLAILKEMQATGLFKKEKLAELYMDLYRQAAPEKKVEVLPAPKDATQMVPVSNIQASSMTPNFDTIRGFFLTGHQKHPKYSDWLTAEEIGKPLNKTADQVKTQSTKYAAQREKELANNVIMKKVINAGGYFKGVSGQVDDFNLPCYIDEELGCMAVWYLMEDGKLVWRNYWSPKAVNQIRQMLGAPALPSPQENLPFLPPDTQAPESNNQF